ncbi:MAG TPA: recombinase A [Planctomycetota bacterium]|nr:recombinase A [Planctomycetota bacterium]
MAALSLRELLHQGHAWRNRPAPPTSWSFGGLAGRYVELTARGMAARLTCAARLVLEAQLAREPAAWVTATASSFHPPDLAEGGIDLDALVVARVPAHGLLPAAEILLRSGAFGIVVLDLDSGAADHEVPLATQTRLVGLAQHHGTLLLCLTRAGVHAPHSLASLRAEASLHPLGGGRFTSEVEVVKDKCAPPGWRQSFVCRAAPGMG